MSRVNGTALRRGGFCPKAGRANGPGGRWAATEGGSLGKLLSPKQSAWHQAGGGPQRGGRGF